LADQTDCLDLILNRFLSLVQDQIVIQNRCFSSRQ